MDNSKSSTLILHSISQSPLVATLLIVFHCIYPFTVASHTYLKQITVRSHGCCHFSVPRIRSGPVLFS